MEGREDWVGRAGNLPNNLCTNAVIKHQLFYQPSTPVQRFEQPITLLYPTRSVGNGDSSLASPARAERDFVVPSADISTASSLTIHTQFDIFHVCTHNLSEPRLHLVVQPSLELVLQGFVRCPLVRLAYPAPRDQVLQIVATKSALVAFADVMQTEIACYSPCPQNPLPPHLSRPRATSTRPCRPASGIGCRRSAASRPRGGAARCQ